MSSKKGKRGNQPRQQAVRQSPQAPRPPAADALIEEGQTRYAAAGEPELPQAADAEVDADLQQRLGDAWRKFRALEQQLQLEATRIESERLKVDAAKAETDAARSALRTEREELDTRRRELDHRESQVTGLESELLAREEAIAEREAAAEGGFFEQRRTSLQAFYTERERLLAEIADVQAELFRQQQDVPRLVKERLAEVAREQAAELDTKRRAVEDEATRLEQANAALDAAREELRREKVALAARELNVVEDEELARARAEAWAGQALEAERLRGDQLERRVEATTSALRQLEEQLEAARKAADRFSGRSPAEVLREIERLQAENEGLRQNLANALGGEAVERLRRLEAERQAWEDERLTLIQEAQEARAMLERARTAAGELEVARDTIRSLEVRITAYREAIETHRADWEQLVEQGRADVPFPECSRMDDDPTVQSPPTRLAEPENLETLAVEIRNRMAALPGDDARFYSAPDVRVFLAGLAMSRLHLLEGISGTGKTSLPLSFAAAVGGGASVVEVQAGWRDRDDLLGHFNAFEGKFYEKDMTQALYESQCPAFAPRPYFIVLDEMNLSHPEQYFADFLSELEQPAGRRRVALRTERTVGAPRLLEDGRYLRLPANVWFIGTANHDETTVGFADKTHDRAHVMELPHHHEPFKPPTRMRAAQPIRYEALHALFDAARLEHQQAAELVNVYLTSDVGDVLRRRFGVGWGNRLVNHVKSFVPVVIGAGGNLGEATDHLLATKLLRKVRDRHDVLPEDFEALQKAIESSWPTLGSDVSEPNKSLAVVRHELRRLGGGG